MKKVSIVGFILVSIAFNVNAQTDDSTYLNKTIERLEAGDCQGAQRFYNVYKELSNRSVKYLEKSIDECFNQQKMKEKQPTTTSEPYLLKKRNKYIAWGILGYRHPGSLVTSIESRFGGIVGVGLYGDIGVGPTDIGYYTYKYYELDYSETSKETFRYAGGVKFFPYKGVFIGCGYGTVATKRTVPASSAERARDMIENSHGFLFHVGYNLVTDLSNHEGFFLGVSGGASYDVWNRVAAPSINLKIGIAWKSE